MAQSRALSSSSFPAAFQAPGAVIVALLVILAASLGIGLEGPDGDGTVEAGQRTSAPSEAPEGSARAEVDQAESPSADGPGELALPREPGRTPGTTGDGPPLACDGTHLCVGASRGIVTPTQSHIDGVEEERAGGTKVQKFNLGGFGVDPLQNFPDPVGALGDELTAPAEATHYEGSQGREDTWIRAMVVQDPSGETVAFVILDSVGNGNVITERATEAISVATGIPKSNILFGATHTHAGADLQGLWGGVPQDWIETVLYPQAIAVVIEAFERLRPAELEVRHGHVDEHNNYRRPKRIDPDIDSDTLMSLLQARDAETGDVIASLLQYNAHPTSINENPRTPHPDYILGATDWLESHDGGTALYFNGPIADASGSGRRQGCDYPSDERYGDVRCRGEGMAQAAMSFELDRVLEPSLEVRHENAFLPVTNPAFLAVGLLGSFNRYYDFLQLPVADIPVIGEMVADGLVNLPQLVPTAQTQVSRITIGGDEGGLEVVTLPGEATGTFGDYVRSLAPSSQHVMLLGLTHNAFGYIIPEEEFNYLDASGKDGFLVPFTGYEEFVSLGPLTAPLLRAQAYAPLFDAGPEGLTPGVAACLDNPGSDECVLHALGRQLDYIQQQMEANCLEMDGPEAFCSLLNPETPLAPVCESAGLPSGVCDLLRSEVGSGGSGGDGRVRAGAAVVDMTPDVGYCAGQHCDVTDQPEALGGGEIDPFLSHKAKHRSYGVQSRLTARAVVVEGGNGKRVALIKTDNYLPQDLLTRRVAQILAEGDSGITHSDIMHHATHNHSSAYSSTWAWGVWIFQDLFDPRFFEQQARKMAQSIELAAADLRPARMGATTVRHTIFKGNVMGLQEADDGTPAGYPKEYGNHDLVVLRFDDISDPASPKPLAAWTAWGQHPEGLDGYDLHSADFLGPLERFVDQELGAPLVFSQSDVGSAERSGNRCHILDSDGELVRDATESFGSNGRANCRDDIAPDEGVVRDWNRMGYVQAELGARYLADDIVRGFREIETIGTDDPLTGKVAFRDDFVVDSLSGWVPGPMSHPHPSVSNCLMGPTLEGNTGVPILGLPDCERTGVPGENPAGAQLAQIVELAKAEGVPLPDHYDAPSFTGVQENLRLHLQVVRLGEVLLASCACEAQADLILNFQSRANQIEGDQFNGFDWACVAEDKGLLDPDPRYADVCSLQREIFDPDEFPTDIRGSLDDAQATERMRAQVHNDARGWNEPENVMAAQSEPEETERIWGNFSHEEIQELGVDGYVLPVGVGMTGDYNGYTVSYREYMNRDHYRKALTSHGPHTADYMVTQLVAMAAQLRGGPTAPQEPLFALGLADEIRQEVMAQSLGAVTSAAYDAWLAALPQDAGPPSPHEQPGDITRFDAAYFTWRGGNTQVDNPVVAVERLVDGSWEPFAGPAGEVQTQVRWPEGLPGVFETYSGSHEWLWNAGFEAYGAFPERLGSTPIGTYRFVAQGCINDGLDDPASYLEQQIGNLAEALLPGLAAELGLSSDGCGGASRPYEVTSETFEVGQWPLDVSDVAWEAGRVSFVVAAIDYPRTYDSQFRYIREGGDHICKECTFRPWAKTGRLVEAEVQTQAGVRGAECAPREGGGWTCSARGVPPTGGTVRVSDQFGNTGQATIPPR
jgi:hypothetical protein